MSSSPLFKRAFVRGLNSQLIREGAAVYPSKQAADSAADYIADNSGMPDPYEEGDKLTSKIASDLCGLLVQASEHQCKEAGNRYSPDLTKTAQDSTPVNSANSDAWDIMQKLAADSGSLIEGGEKPNDQPAAATDNAEAALEANRRPENYANMGEKGVGNYEGKGEGSVGTEQKPAESPGATDGGSNSIVENTNKHGSLADIVKRVSKSAADTGSLIDGGEARTVNDQPAAAANNAEAALEANRRPENYANKGERGVGQTDMKPPANAVVGDESPHPEAPKTTDGGSNSIIAQTKNGSAFDQLFKEAAEQLVPYLPTKMEDTKKVAHIRAMMGLDTEGRATYIENMYSTSGYTKEASASIKDHFVKAASTEEKKPDEEAPQMPPAMTSGKDKPKEEPEPEKTASVKPDNSLSNLRSRLVNLNA